MKRWFVLILAGMLVFSGVAMATETNFDVASLAMEELYNLRGQINDEIARRTETPEPTPAPTISYPPVPTPAPYEFTNTQNRLHQSSFGLRFETLIEITNTGADVLYFGSQNYDIEDVSGKILATGSLSSFPDILHPGEKGYFYDSVEVTGIGAKDKVVFVPRWNIKKSEADRINFDLSNIEVREGTFGTTVYGKIANNTGEDQSWAIISVVLYAKDGDPIGVWMTNVMEDMPVGSKFGFEVAGVMNRTLRDKVTANMVDHWTAYAYPPQYQW